MMEFPASAIASRNGWRHAQITALSFSEMRAAITHAAKADWPGFCLVSHSFELYNRDTQRPNALLCRRFERLCQWLGASKLAYGAGFNDLDGDLTGADLALLPHNYARTGVRMAKQLAANTVFR